MVKFVPFFLRLLVLVVTLAGCYSAHSIDDVGGLAGTLRGPHGALHLDPLEGRFEQVAWGSVLACTGDVSDAMARRWRRTIEHMLAGESLGSLRCVSFLGDEGGPAICSAEAFGPARALHGLASEALPADDVCEPAAEVTLGQVDLPDRSVAVASDGQIYIEDAELSCGRLPEVEARSLLRRLAEESPRAPTPGGAGPARVYVAGHSTWGDLGGANFPASEPTTDLFRNAARHCD